jgi:hypothetical protein
MSRELKLSIVAGIAFFLGATFRTFAPAHAQDVGSIDVVMVTAATVGATDGPDKPRNVAERAPDYIGVDLLASWEGDKSPKITRHHDRQSGVEFICVRDRGCVLTGRSWK